MFLGDPVEFKSEKVFLKHNKEQPWYRIYKQNFFDQEYGIYKNNPLLKKQFLQLSIKKQTGLFCFC